MDDYISYIETCFTYQKLPSFSLKSLRENLCRRLFVSGEKDCPTTFTSSYLTIILLSVISRIFFTALSLREWGYSKTFCTVQPLTLLYTIWREKVPLSKKGTRFTYLLKNSTFLFVTLGIKLMNNTTGQH